MSLRTTPPFRADHVGSLLRPPNLLQARADKAEGRLSADELRAVEDEAIRDVVRMQRDVGLALGHRRGVPPHLLAHGLHLPARRRRARPTADPGPDAQRGGRRRVHRAGPADQRADPAERAHLRRRLRLPAVHCGRRRDGQADDPVAVDGPLPRRPGRDRPGRLPGRRRVLGRPVGRLRRPGQGDRRARLPVPAARRHQPGLPQRPRPAGRARPSAATTPSTSTCATSSRSTPRWPTGRRRCASPPTCAGATSAPRGRPPARTTSSPRRSSPSWPSTGSSWSSTTSARAASRRCASCPTARWSCSGWSPPSAARWSPRTTSSAASTRRPSTCRSSSCACRRSAGSPPQWRATSLSYDEEVAKLRLIVETAAEVWG